MARLLEILKLSVEYGPDAFALRGVDIVVDEGEALALIGESGSGKSTVALSILNYLGAGGRVVSGGIRFRDTDLLKLGRRERQQIYGRRIAHVAQDPMSALNPALRIETQLTEGIRTHLRLAPAEARARAERLLNEVHLPEPERLLRAYPHHLSGGMQQRVCIAMALACDPDLVVLDEPTTGLDAATEAGILALLKELKEKRRLAVLFISHNLSLVAGLADRVAIMYGGRVVEFGPASAIFSGAAHRYTQMLLQALPALSQPDRGLVEIPWQDARIPHEGCPFRDRCDIATKDCETASRWQEIGVGHATACIHWQRAMERQAAQGNDGGTVPVRTPPPSADAEILLDVQELSHSFAKFLARSRGARRNVVDQVSFSLRRGEVLALIGESGSGKSTLARCLVGLIRPRSGAIRLRGLDLARMARYPRDASRQMQIVFQNIAGSLHPRKTLDRILSRPYALYERRRPAPDELRGLVASVGLKSGILPKRPSALSGGERQRAALARAYAPKPEVMILDEAFSALDVSTKVKAARLLLDKKRELNASYIFISHDLPFVRYVADRIMVMYRGSICEIGPRTTIQSPPFHPYTETLVWAALDLEGMRPTMLQLGTAAKSDSDASAATGCKFKARCPRKLGEICDREAPPLQRVAPEHWIACHIPSETLSAVQRAEWRPSKS